MTLKTSKLRDAISFALVSGATVIAGTGVAFAQDSSEQQATTLDRIEVTGSRIRQVDVETAQPVVMISREDIQAGGFNTVADILQNIPSAGSPTFSRTSPLVGLSSDARIFSNVVLPEPDSPIMATYSPCSTEKETFDSAVT